MLYIFCDGGDSYAFIVYMFICIYCVYHTCSYIYIYMYILYVYIASSPLLELRTTWIRLGKLVHSGTKFRPRIYKFHLGHFHHHHPHHHQHHHHHHQLLPQVHMNVNIEPQVHMNVNIPPHPPTPRVRSINCCRKFAWTLTSCRKFTWTLTSHPTPPHPACA